MPELTDAIDHTTHANAIHPTFTQVRTQRQRNFFASLVEVNTTSVEDALRMAGMDFATSTMPAWAGEPNNLTSIPDRSYIGKRDDDGAFVPFNEVSSLYTPVQYQDMAAPLQGLIDEKLLGRITYAGTLNKGARGFLLAEVAENMQSSLRDPHRRAILAITGHDGSMSLRFKPWVTRVFCSNQIPAMTRRNDVAISIRHTPGASVNVEGLPAALHSLVSRMGLYDTMYEQMLNTSVTRASLLEYASAVFPETPDATDRMKGAVEKKRFDLQYAYKHEPSQSELFGTVAGLFQAAVFWSDWLSPTRGQTDPQDRRSARSLLGLDAEFKMRAFKQAQLMLAA